MGIRNPYFPAIANTWQAGQMFKTSAFSNFAYISPALSSSSIYDGIPFVGVFQSSSSLYYGIIPFLGTTTPSNVIALGGYYHGLGVQGTSTQSDTKIPIFGVLAESQSASGIGNVNFTVYNTGEIDSYWISMGGQPKSLSPTIASGTVYQNTSSSYQTLTLPFYASTAGTAGTVTINMGTSSTPGAWTTVYVSGGTSSTATTNFVLRVPPQWYYEVVVSGATIGTVNGVQE